MNASASLKPYMAWAGGDPEDGAVLVFAHNSRQAKRLGYDALRGWSSDMQYIETRVRLQRDHGEWMQRLANPEALAAGRAHVVDDPSCCNACETWGTPLTETGICERCVRDSVVDDVVVH